MEKIIDIESSVEAAHWVVVLEENQIPHVIRQLNDPIYGGALSLGKPYAQLLADAQYKTQILSLRKEIKN